MEKNDNYFDNKSESERMRNVANMVNDIVNAKPEEEIAAVAEGDGTDEDPKPEEPEVNPLVDAVGKAISNHKPRGMFMQGVQTDDNPKL
jgi:predicted neutral ceramidase superfamily lipid hydrolase